MCHLYIDTSQAYIILGLNTNGNFCEKIISHNNKIGSYLAIAVKNFIENQGYSLSQIKTIICGVGPGSYTGTRVGVAFAESLAFGLDIPLIKIPSLLFYIKPDELGLLIPSHFETFGCLTIEGDVYSYCLINKNQAPLSFRILDPKNLSPQPAWALIAAVKTQNPLKDLLYFSLN